MFGSLRRPPLESVRVLAIVALVAVLVGGPLSAVIVGAGGVTTSDAVPRDATGSDVPGSGVTGGGENETPVAIDGRLASSESAGETVEVVVRLAELSEPVRAETADRDRALRAHAERSQGPIVDYADRTAGVTVRQRFWIANAVLLEVDTSRVDLETFGRFEDVRELHANFEVEVNGGAAATTPAGPGWNDGQNAGAAENADDESTDTTYGLAQIDAPAVWERYGTRGEGVRVAVLDTGVEPDHPDLTLYTDDPNDPTYPGGWAEFDSNGNRITGSEPYDSGDHGTHVSGTVVGGDASGTAIGVAPGADLMHGNVLGPNGGYFSSVIGGMEWAVENDADVVSMSLGPTNGGYVDSMIDPIRNAEANGVVVVASIGNDGEGTSGTPGNDYDSLGIGASDSNADIRSFSGGETIRTADAWNSPPSDWPDEYVVPDLAAPGSSVYSAAPDGSYGWKSGTSMAAPHVAGTVALMVSVRGDVTPDEVERALSDTAWKPDGAPIEKDTRYGHGIVDAKAATDAIALATIEGTVTSAAGEPVENATVIVDGVANATTDANGTYELTVESGDRTVNVSAVGFYPREETLTLTGGTTTTHDVALESILAASVVGDQRSVAEGGENVSVAFDVENVSEVTVSLADETTVDPANATLFVNGTETTFGQTRTYDERFTDDSFDVTVSLADGTNGTLALESTFATGKAAETRITGPTSVFETVYDVGVVADSDEPGADALSDSLGNDLPDRYRLDRLNASRATNETDAFEIFVVLQLFEDDDRVATFANRTAEDGVGAVFLGGSAAADDPLSRIATATGEPGSVHTESVGADVRALVDRGHPIVTGVAAERERFTLVENASNRTWFDPANARSIASIVDEGSLGTGLSTARADRRVYLAATPRDGTLTPAGRSALSNAVAHLGSGDLYAVDDLEFYTVSGETGTAVFGLPGAGEATVSLTDGTTVDSANVTLFVNGTERAPGESFAVDEETAKNGLSVEVTVDPDVEGDVGLSLAYGDETAITETTVLTNPPARYYGTATVNGAPARDGLTVRATVDGDTVAESTVTDGGYFGYEDPLEVAAATGDEVVFHLEDAPANRSVAWATGDQRDVSFDVSYDDPFANATLVGDEWTNESARFSLTEFESAYVTGLEWTFGDTGTASGAKVSHAYERDDRYTVTVTGTTLGGEEYAASHRIIVDDDPPIDVGGRLVRDGDPLSGAVLVSSDAADWVDRVELDADGSFVGTGLEGAFHHVVFVRDPAVHEVDRYAAATVARTGFENATDLGNVTVPTGSPLDIRVVDESGTPVEGASIGVAPVTGIEDHHVRIEGTTNADGAYLPDGGTRAGITVDGNVTVVAAPPADDRFVETRYVRNATVENDTALTIELAERSTSGGGGGGGDGPEQIFYLERTPTGDGAVHVRADAPKPGETARGTLENVGTDRVQLTQLDVTAADERPFFEFTLRPGSQGSVPALDGAVEYFTVEHDGIDDAVRSTTFHYRVDRSVIPDGVRASDLVLYRYDSAASEWTVVDTEMRGGAHRSTTAAFSTFAIAPDTREPAYTVVESAIDPEEIRAGETVTIAATVENTGDGAGSERFDLIVGGDTVVSERHFLEPGERVTITAEVDPGASARVSLSGTTIGEVTVVDAAGREIAADGSTDGSANGSIGEDGSGGAEDNGGGDENGENDGSDSAPERQVSSNDDGLPGFGLGVALFVLALVCAGRVSRRS